MRRLGQHYKSESELREKILCQRATRLKEEDSSIFLLLSFALFKLLVLLAEKMACKCPKIVKMSPEGIKTFSELLIRMIFTSDAGDKKIRQMRAYYLQSFTRLPSFVFCCFVFSQGLCEYGPTRTIA